MRRLPPQITLLLVDLINKGLTSHIELNVLPPRLVGLSRAALTPPFPTSICIEYSSLLPVCISNLLHRAEQCGSMPLCLGDWHVAVGVGWLRHCHSLDVMRKSTLDLPLWSALLEDLRDWPVSAAESTEGAQYHGAHVLGAQPLSSSQAGARPTDCCNKIHTSLSETATSQACAGRGGDREERVGVGKKEHAWVADTSHLSVYVSFLKGEVG